jgi:hypothetical protein
MIDDEQVLSIQFPSTSQRCEKREKRELESYFFSFRLRLSKGELKL